MRRRGFVAAGSAVAALTAWAASTGVANGAGKSKSMGLETFKKVILAWRRGDLDAVLANVTDDIVWHSHVGSPPVLGKAAMRTVLQTLAASMKDVRWRLVNHAESGSMLFAEGVEEFVNPAGHRVALPYMGIAVFRGGLIAEWRDYFDRALYDRMKSGEVSPEYIRALVARPGVP
jgi:limonene-1,2-epoxide hydrolase